MSLKGDEQVLQAPDTEHEAHLYEQASHETPPTLKYPVKQLQTPFASNAPPMTQEVQTAGLADVHVEHN